MAVRISWGTGSEVNAIVVEGRLDAEAVGELRRVLAGGAPAVPLQLRGLRSADESGLQALRELKADGFPLRGLSPYLTLLMETPVGDADPRPPRDSDTVTRRPRRDTPSRTARRKGAGPKR